MRPTLQLKMGQQLTMTPQLQQAIRLLQLSSLELQQEIQDALDNNPLLEESNEELAGQEQDKSDNDTDPVEEYNKAQEQASSDETEVEWTKDEIDTNEALQSETIGEDLPTDSNWDDYMSAAPSGASSTFEGEDTVYQGETSDDIQDHLRWQLNLSPMSDLDFAIAEAIIDGVDEKGFLTLTAEEIVDAVDDEGDDQPQEHQGPFAVDGGKHGQHREHRAGGGEHMHGIGA